MIRPKPWLMVPLLASLFLAQQGSKALVPSFLAVSTEVNEDFINLSANTTAQADSDTMPAVTTSICWSAFAGFPYTDQWQTIEFVETTEDGTQVTNDLQFADTGQTDQTGRCRLDVTAWGHVLPDATVRRIKGTWKAWDGSILGIAHCYVYLRRTTKSEALSSPAVDASMLNPSRPYIPYTKDSSIVQSEMGTYVDQCLTDMSIPGKIVWTTIGGSNVPRVHYKQVYGATWSDWARTITTDPNRLHWRI